MRPSTHPRFSFALLTSFLAIAFAAAPAFATCGGGGGGGMGGAAGGMGGAPEVYRVPWIVLSKGKAIPAGASLYVLWFPTSADAAKKSDLLTSRTLALAGARCVAELLVPPDNAAIIEKYKVAAGTETVVLTAADGTEISRAVPDAKGKFAARNVEKLVTNEIDAREKKFTDLVKAAEKKAKTGDKAAVDELNQVWGARCLFPSLGKRAAKGLKQLGSPVDDSELKKLGADDLRDPDVKGEHADVEPVLLAGLKAELAADYETARTDYLRAVQMDPSDPTTLRFLGEYYRHITGQCDLAQQTFHRLLAQPADPIGAAVALHGLGKMTIHSGRYADGLALFQQSIDTYPLPITYRNLAVYWFSEKQADKAAGFMREAIALDPDDLYNQIFAAVYLAAAGQKEEALKIARANESVLEASYNLAAIWSQAGDQAKAMELLRRHFYEYERFNGVRTMEMQEARDDYMFSAMHHDQKFVDLTRFAARNACGFSTQ